MSYGRRFGALLALVIAGAWVPTPADACTPPPDDNPPDPCEETVRWSEIEVLNGARLSTDGVVVITGTPVGWGWGDNEAHLDRISVELRDEDGNLHPGAAELPPHDFAFRYFVWRPDAPLPPDEALTLVARYDNASADSLGQCAPDEVTAEHELVTVESLGFVPEPQVVVNEAHRFGTSLSDPVCCDGGMIKVGYDVCWPTTYYDEGFCIGQEGVWGTTAEIFTLTQIPEGEGPFVFYTTVGGSKYDEAVFNVDVPPSRIYGPFEPDVVSARFVDLRDGSVYDAPPVDIGLDPHPLEGEWVPHPDLGGALAEQCEGEPYVCEDLGEGRWDPDACEAWDGEVDDGEGDDDDDDDETPEDDDDVFPTGEDDDERAPTRQTEGEVSCRVAPDPGGAAPWFAILVVALRRRRRAAPVPQS